MVPNVRKELYIPEHQQTTREIIMKYVDSVTTRLSIVPVELKPPPR